MKTLTKALYVFGVSEADVIVEEWHYKNSREYNSIKYLDMQASLYGPYKYVFVEMEYEEEG